MTLMPPRARGLTWGEAASASPADDMHWIPGGEFRMGSDRHYPEERPAHRVRVDGFEVDVTPVTNADFADFVAATSHVTVAERPLDPSLYPGARPAMLAPGSLVFRMTAFTLIAVTALVVRSSVRVSGRNAAYVGAVGIGDTLGNGLFAAASAYGLVSVTSVLASLYPIVTVVLARIVLHERVDRAQEAGVVATLAGVVLISAG